MKLLYTFLFSFTISFCFAQQNPDNQVVQNSISINSGHYQFKDENLHPKVFRGLNIGAIYSHAKIRKNISQYSVGLNIAALNTVYEEFPTALSFLIHGNFKNLFPVFTNDRLKYYVGPIADIQYGANVYFNWDESHLYHANYISGGISNRLNYQIGNYNLELNLDIPLISGISRPKPNRQYKIDEMSFAGIMKNLASNPEFALPDNNFYLKTGLELKHRTKKMKFRSIGYDLQYHYMKSAIGEPYQHIGHVISYKFIF